ncbi:MAG: hypothetical protein KDB79_11515 [Acidobacteria bacterium]|nr:hypothetical protein [Acidobacteriota bacterium]
MNKKCTNCNLANFADADECVRCESLLGVASSIPGSAQKRSLTMVIFRRASICISVLLFVIAGFYVSMYFSAKPLTSEQSAVVGSAIGVLEKAGFSREVFYLKNFTAFRSNDNWLNSLTTKENAYAATNFPFEIMTIYQDFFTFTEDDVERAAILLHEAIHLQGGDEKEAYEFVWKNRSRIGWTEDRYKNSTLWKNVRRQTREYVPELFICDFNEFGDCTRQ